LLSNVYFIYEFKNEDIYVITSYISKRERYYRIEVVFVKIREEIYVPEYVKQKGAYIKM